MAEEGAEGLAEEEEAEVEGLEEEVAFRVVEGMDRHDLLLVNMVQGVNMDRGRFKMMSIAFC